LEVKIWYNVYRYLYFLTDTLVVEFMNSPQSTMMLRRVRLNKNNYKEQYSSEVYLFGGIRKLNNKEDIEKWKAYFNLV